MTAQVLDLKRIGCSDLAAILGRDRWREPCDVWARIVHGIEPERSAVLEEMGAWGLRLEEPVARAGLDKLKHCGPLYRPPSIKPSARPWQRYSIDFIAGLIDATTGIAARLQVAGSLRVLECKVRSSHALDAAGWGADGTADVAEDVLVQVQGQLEAVKADRDSWLGTDVPDLEVADVLVLVDGQRLRHYPVPYDAELAGMVREEAERFWRDYVLTATPPPLEYGEGTARELRRRYPHLSGETVATPEMEEIARAVGRIDLQLADLDIERDQHMRKLAEMAGSATRIRAEGWSWSQWDQAPNPKWSALVEELATLAKLDGPALEALTAKHRGPATRRSRLTTKKGPTT